MTKASSKLKNSFQKEKYLLLLVLAIALLGTFLCRTSASQVSAQDLSTNTQLAQVAQAEGVSVGQPEGFDSVDSLKLLTLSHQRQGNSSPALSPSPNSQLPIPNSQSTTTYLYQDHLGSVDTIADEENNLINKKNFSPFGSSRDVLGVSESSSRDSDEDKSEIKSPSNPQPLTSSHQRQSNLSPTLSSSSISHPTRGYTDHEHLSEQELIHMNGRVYDHNLGKFISSDPVVQDAKNSQNLNRYSYVLNNPMSYVDPSGYFLEETGKRYNTQNLTQKIIPFAFSQTPLERFEQLSLEYNQFEGRLSENMESAYKEYYSQDLTEANLKKIIAGSCYLNSYLFNIEYHGGAESAHEVIVDGFDLGYIGKDGSVKNYHPLLSRRKLSEGELGYRTLNFDKFMEPIADESEFITGVVSHTYSAENESGKKITKQHALAFYKDFFQVKYKNLGRRDQISSYNITRDNFVRAVAMFFYDIEYVSVPINSGSKN